MRLATILAFVILAPGFARAQDAKAVAQEVLNKGAALFDTRDAAAMAETYTDDAKLTWIEKDSNTGKFKVEVKEGRSDIEKLYSDLFKDAKEKTTSRNTVEFAKFISPSLLLIEGEFEPKINEGKYSFVQERIKQGDKWVIMALRIYVVPQD
jgi:hypothetical protein